MLVSVLKLSFTALTTVLSAQAWAGDLVKVETSVGSFFVEMNNEQTPNTVTNFLNYVTSNRYNLTLYS